ncbi:MAG TPA: hypothetical protein VFX92_02565 [Candidatus Krumholzibacteria bacterium]|nr:hypothetical protein [Candidatus Krumholzibacteria bacterium]
MIYYLATAGFTHTMETYLAHWCAGLSGNVRIVTYDEALRASSLPLGTYVFSDLERLLPTETEIAELVWDQLNIAGARLLNHPTRTLKRYDLLTKMHALGRNEFRALRATERHPDIRFPVFIRDESEHSGNISRLLGSHRDLDEALAGAVVRGHRLKHLLVVEYCDTVGADGLYRKYAAFCIDGQIVPGHMDCSRQWMVKDTDVVDPAVLAAERAFLESNPHRAWLKESFALAGTDYGRMDYSLMGDTPQLWEINTNPVLILNPANYAPEHMPTKHFLAGQLAGALRAADSIPSDARVDLSIPDSLYRRLDAEKKQLQRARNHRSTVRWIKRWPLFRAVRWVVHPLVRPMAPLLTRNNGKRSQ